MPRPFEKFFGDHEVQHTCLLNWGQLENGNLLRAAEEAGFEAIVTVDQNIPYQQSLKGRSLSLIVIRSRSNAIPDLMSLVPKILAALEKSVPGTLHVVA